MNLALTVLEISAPVFFLGSLGFLWVRLGWDYPIAFVTRLAMSIAVPSLIFVSLVGAEIEPSALASLGIATLAAYLALAFVFWVFVRVRNLNSRTYLAPLTFGNTGNLGLPLALFAFGDAGLSLAIVVFGVMAVIMFTLGLWMVAGFQAPWRVLREPILWAAVLGCLSLAFGWSPPEVVMTSLGLVGQLGIPLMLLTLGAAVAGLHPGHLRVSFGLSTVKLIVSVAIALSVGWILGLTGLPFAVLVLQLATPVGVTSYLLSERYGQGPDEVAGLIVTSTLLAIAALPITLTFLLLP